jgi:hypothetical protein
VLEHNNFNRINIATRLKIIPNSGLRDAVFEDRMTTANKDKVVRAG